RVEVTRSIIAKRLGRLTGSGLFAQSQKLGEEQSWRESGVNGCDSVQNAVYRGQYFWLWGDTSVPRYPLGIFEGTAATTVLKPLNSLVPPLRLKWDYMADANGTPRAVAKMPGAGPTWVTAVAVLPDRAGKPRLVGSFAKIKAPMDTYQWGLCVWNDEAAQFEL